MALQTKVINGKPIKFDTEVRDEIINQFLPDGGSADANLADWAVLVAGVMFAAATKNPAFNTKTAQIYINGKSTVVDGATNYISASSGDWKAFARAVTTAIVGTGVGFGTGVISEFAVGPVGGAAVGFFAGNAASTQAGQYWDYLFGPDVNVLLSIDNSSAVIKSSGTLDNVLKHHWSNSNKQLSIKDIANTYGEYTLTCTSGEGPVNYTYEKSANKYTYASGGTKHNLEELLKYLAVGDLPTFFIRGEKHELIRNFMNSSPLSGADLHDRATLYAALELQGFVFKDESGRYDQLNIDEFSDMFLKDRAKMFNAYTHEPTDLPAYNTTYIDLGQNNPNSNFITYDPNNIIKGYRDGNVGTVVFGTDSNDTYGAATGMGVPNGELHLYGRGGNDTLYGNIGNDWLEGGDGGDTLEGGAGKDVLIGGFTKDQVDAFTDHLHGGAGKDTYISGDSDHIRDDSAGEGRVYFEGKLLTGGTKKAGAGCEPTEDNGDSLYYGDGGVYRLSGNTLTFTKNGKILTIEEYQKRESGYVGITLKDNPGDGDACPSPTHDCPKPVNPLFNFNFSLPTPTVSIGGGGGGGTYYGGGGGGGGSYTHNTSSTPHRTPTPPAPELPCPNLPTHHSAGTGGGGGGTPPIVLDLNRNGITSISLAASTALFDYDGDGVLENTAWIESGDALLVNDVNNDGIINNASELFGNYTRNSDGSVAKSGYQALSYYDTNGDGIVNSTDTRFEELKLWIDSNGDGVTDAGELHTLTEMGVTSLALNSATPYIPTTENTNTIIQETTFTDANGEGVMRDVLFRYENNSTNTEGVYFDMDGNGIQEKMLTWTDPNEWMVVKDINGDGIINSGREVVGNQMILRNGTKPADTIQALKTFDINHDGKIDTADNSGLAFWTDRNHNGLTDVGAIQVVYFRNQRKAA
jgi:Ca2+-binding RTX toxin-like protein